MVLYKSTRGVSPAVSFQEALLSGYAPDGGLYVPHSLPKLDRDVIKQWAKLSYADLVVAMFSYFVSSDEISEEEMKGILDGCYSKFDNPADIIPISTAGDVRVAELWHGPTGAFKDLALCAVGRLVDFFLSKNSRKANIIMCTSGDTGSAAIDSVLGSQHINICVWYPRDRVSRVQQLQMTTVNAPNVKVFAADGSSDDIDIPVKKLFADREFVLKHDVMSFSSINISRVLLQAVHFTYLYLKVCPSVDKEVTFCVPCGALGNVTGGTVARRLGVPMTFIGAVNENDLVDRAFRLNDFSVGVPLHTPSSAMDIQVPYNIERIFYYLSGERSDIVKSLMEEFERDEHCKIPDYIMEANTFLTTVRVDSAELFSTMKLVWDRHHYPLCPHSAVAMAAALRLGRTDSVVMATATPAKFPEVMSKGGVPAPKLERIERLYSLAEHETLVERDQDWFTVMKDGVKSFD